MSTINPKKQNRNGLFYLFPTEYNMPGAIWTRQSEYALKNDSEKFIKPAGSKHRYKFVGQCNK